MKIYAINGGPRKGWNTDTMLKKFLEGAASVSDQVETEMVYLYDLDYKGCVSCFACQRNNEKTNGQCQVRDGIYDLLRKIPLSDGVVFGCPIFFHDVTAQLRAFLERLLYQYIDFDKDSEGSHAPKKLPLTMIYTMNVTEQAMLNSRYDFIVGSIETYMQSIFGTRPEQLFAFNTYQFDDYSKYRVSYWDEAQKAEQRKTQFPIDCQAAFEAGKRMAEAAMNTAGEI